MMLRKTANPRIPETEVDAVFTDRWSPRAFLDQALSDAQVASLFEAARWAPSCYNDQPWHFRYARTPADRALFAGALSDKNQLWAPKAPLLIFVLARRHFGHSAKPNRHAVFDAGAAWMSIALQARRLGLYAHAMAGFDSEKAYTLLKVKKEEFDIMAAVAVGYRGEVNLLNQELADIEVPNGRKPLADVAGEGAFPG